MKNLLFVATVVALLSFVACQKESALSDNPAEGIEEIRESPVFTAVIGNANTKTTVLPADDLQSFKVNWELTDEITVKDASANTAIYEVSELDPDTGVAKFTIKEGQSALGSGPYSATYGTEPPVTQIWTEIPGESDFSYSTPLYMEAPETDDNTFTFDVKCGGILFGLVDYEDNTIKSISAICTPEGSTEEKVYTLVCEDPQTFSLTSPWMGFLSAPVGSFNKILISNDKGLVYLKYNYKGESDNTPVTVQQNKVLMMQLWCPAFHLLSSEFSIGSNAKVMFTAGNNYVFDSDNLWEKNQYDIRNTPEDGSVGLFYWCYSSQQASLTNFNSNLCGTYFFASDPSKDNSSVKYYGSNLPYGGSSRNFALSKEQWEYLLNLDGQSGRSQEKRFAKAKYNNVNGLLVFPDNYDGVTSGDGFSALNDRTAGFPDTNISAENWSTLLAKGVLFLPVAGKRWYEEEQVKFDATAAHYWTSSLEDSSKSGADDKAIYLDFGGNDITFVAGSRSEGRAVRLAKPANLFFTPTSELITFK